jgi:hypothetical protein
MAESNLSQAEPKNGSALPDFSSAEHFLDLARKAHVGGDEKLFRAARKMVLIALGLNDENNPRR